MVAHSFQCSSYGRPSTATPDMDEDSFLQQSNARLHRNKWNQQEKGEIRQRPHGVYEVLGLVSHSQNHTDLVRITSRGKKSGGYQKHPERGQGSEETRKMLQIRGNLISMEPSG